MPGLARTPVTELDLVSPAFKEDPFPTWARLRALGPVVRVRLPIFGTVWLATTYEAVNDLLRDHQHFVQNPAAAGNRWMGTIVRWLPGGLRPLAANMLLRDPPDHRRLRGLVDQAFQRQSIEALRPRLETLAEESLDRLAAAAARSRRGVDLVAHFARPFPLSVICELLGLPAEDHTRFTRWAGAFSKSFGFAALFETFAGLNKLMLYCRSEYRRQRRRPRGGLLAALIQAEEAGDRLTEDELVAMVFLLLAAGHETTLHQIACSVLTLFDHPEQLDRLCHDWGLADLAVEELLRYVSFAQVSKPRYAREDVEFGGQSIRKGQIVFACLASANSDPAVFSEPTRLDLGRPSHRHVAFGAGIHVCLGAKLARVETAIALQRLFTRFPRLSLAVPRSQVRYARRMGLRALDALPVRW
ncbi:MAG: cytochrome P450 [Planctomycetia bacterium]|nr:cytochrome P450 [Planctomycetia bacterium]